MEKNTETISGLRYQKYDKGEVHVHDDKQSIKFELDVKTFKTDLAGALKALDKKEGVVKINGDTEVNLYLLNDRGNLISFIAKEDDTRKALKKFLETL